MSVNIGYFQFLPQFLQVKDNLKMLERLLSKNKKTIRKLDLVVFPEYFLSGPLKIDLLKDYEKEIT